MTDHNKTQRLLLTIDSSLQDTVLAAMAVRGICTLTRLTPEEINSVELCVVEVVNNVIVHAYANESGHPVEVELRYLPDRELEIVVSDSGRSMSEGSEGLQERSVALNPDDPETWLVSGRGLAIVKRLMDSSCYRSCEGRNSFYMIKKFSRVLP